MKPDSDTDIGTRPGRPKSQEKRSAILEAAGGLFLARGLSATSMDLVAEHAGVSKQTVYSHFASKDDLYRSCITAKVASYGLGETDLSADAGLNTILFTIGERFLDLIFDKEAVAMYRVVIGESAVHPKIAELFYENGPGKTRRRIADFMQAQMQRGLLREDDPDYVTMLFLNMLRGPYHMQLLMNLKTDFDADTKNRHIRKVVDQFLALYAK